LNGGRPRDRGNYLQTNGADFRCETNVDWPSRQRVIGLTQTCPVLNCRFQSPCVK
jgi:hypothetical protein